MSIHPDDTYDGGRLCPDVTTKPGGHHPECCCSVCQPDHEPQSVKTPCPCGDYYCSDSMPTNQDRSQCCMYCGYYNCDVCGWVDPARVTSSTDEVPW